MNRTIKKFLAAHSDPEACWLWPGKKDGDGYGWTKISGMKRRAHRAVYEASGFVIPQGLLLLHRCDTPACCNPFHLWPRTQKENCQDAKAKDRHSRSTRQGNAKLNDDAVREIRRYALSQNALARRFGVRQSLIWRIIHRKAWAHVAG